MRTYVVGIDCATKHNNIGLALAVIEDGACRIIEVGTGDGRGFPEGTCVGRDPISIIKAWHKKKPIDLLALDAPLGWPISLGNSLFGHWAGGHIPVDSDLLFHRKTDEIIGDLWDKRPLEVGANLIARTAKSALDLLYDLKPLKGAEIPLAWQMGHPSELSAIEVYPAATCISLQSGLQAPPGSKKTSKLKQKKKDDAAVHTALYQLSTGYVTFPPDFEPLNRSRHEWDAVFCAIAAMDFVNKKCLAPTPQQLNLAKREGWIWVADRPLKGHPISPGTNSPPPID